MMQNKDDFIKVGLTGGIGTGKSTISAYLKDKGIDVIDADKISREVFSIYPNITQLLKLSFGTKFFDEEGNLKRREFGSYIFENENRRKNLEEIIIPYIKKEIFERMEKYKNEGKKICVVDAPTLIENELHKDMSFNILVWADENTQMERVKYRDNLTYEEVLKRIKAQMPLDEKKKYVDFIVDNTKTLEYTKTQVDEILNKILMK